MDLKLIDFHLEIMVQKNELSFSSDTHQFEEKEDIFKILNFLKMTTNEIETMILDQIQD